MPTASIDASTVTLLMSSAVVSALVNVAWNAYAKSIEREKEDAKENLRLGHIYLELVFELESFARKCSERIYDISAALDRYANHDGAAFDGLGDIVLELDAVPDWTALPVSFVAKVKALPSRFEKCNQWIIAQHEYWADLDEAYQFEEERLAFYATEATTLSEQIRRKIDAGKGDMYDIINHLSKILQSRRTAYKKQPQSFNCIPELKAKFEKEEMGVE